MSEQSATSPEFERLLNYLKYHRGFDFSGYKRTSLMRRVSRRMQDVRIESFEEYLDYLEVHPDEYAFLFNTILINVTGFFRDAPIWTYLADEVVPRILDRHTLEQPIRIWSTGCASGEEPYSLAMLMAEALGSAEEVRRRVKIYATDVDEDALARARMASYTPQDVQAVPGGMREKYFQMLGGRYIFDEDLRRAVIFGHHDVLQDAPISHLDLLVCRNTLIYFNAEAQSRVLARFHFALEDGGVLFLGRAEMLLVHTELFTPLNLQHRIFAKVPRPALRQRMEVISQAGQPTLRERTETNEQSAMLAIESLPYALLVIDREGVLLMANARARVLFNLDPHLLGQSMHSIELYYRPVALRPLIEQATSERQGVIVPAVRHVLPSGEAQYLSVYVEPLLSNGRRAAGAFVTFLDVTAYERLRMEHEQSRQSLETTSEELQATNEELETTNEELQSTVEELQTTNEELQSSNEEMETMNEELEATNEELQAVNRELQQRTLEVDQANAFLESILSSARVALVVLDRQQNVILWNERARDLWGLQANEVVGHPFFDLDIGLPVEALRDPVNTVMKGRQTAAEVNLDSVNRRGRPIRCRIDVARYEGMNGDLQGAVLSMQEIDEGE